MSISRIATRLSKTLSTQCRNSLLFHARKNEPRNHHHYVPILCNQFHSLRDPPTKVTADQFFQANCSVLNRSGFQRFFFSSSATPESNVKETGQSGNGQGSASKDTAAAADQTETSVSDDASVSRKKDESDTELEALSRDDLVKLLLEKEDTLKLKVEEFSTIKDKYMRAYAEMENVMARTKREAENSKKFAVQNFAKGLLDVADNLTRAASVVKESFSKINQSNDTAGAVPLLKTLLEGVEMTDKQLGEVFKKAGIEKFDPVNEQFDPNKHNAIFQVPDPSKPPGTVAVVLKAGYTLHDRILRPAEVGVTVAMENEETNQPSDT